MACRERMEDLAFDTTGPSLNPPFSKPILGPIPISYQLEEAFILNKTEENIHKTGNEFDNGYLIGL